MKTASPCLACVTALALAIAAVVVPAPAKAEPGPEPNQKPIAPTPHSPKSPYVHTALGAVIEANGGNIPRNGIELASALAKLGDFVQLPVTFSAVALNSGLSHPRVVITMRPASLPGQVEKFVPNGKFRPASWGNFPQPDGSMKLVAGTPALLGQAKPNKPYLEGRLFLAANTDTDDIGQPFVKTVEFISWNSRKQKFDFGVIEGMGGIPEVKMLDGSRCFSCHKNRGPILGVSPWSNTAHNDLIRSTSAAQFKFPARIEKDANGNIKTTPRDDIDGLKLLKPSGPEVDAAVRQGADVLRDRERFKLLVRTADGRKVLVMLLAGVVARGELDAIDKKLKIEINSFSIVKFLQDAHSANKTLAPSTLADFSPAGPVNKPILTQSPDGQVNQVTKYNAIRATGDHGLLTQHQPSNPKAFIRPPSFTPRNNSDLVNVVMLARAIGLSEDDRSFLATALAETAEKLPFRTLTLAALARVVFTGPKFADVLKSGVMPERDDFKDLFVAGLVDVMRAKTKIETFWHPRESYASAPKLDPNAPPEKEVVVLPSHSCLGCHDIRGPGKPPAFSPIPMLSFDPFDKVSREAWLKTADRKQKVQFLSRLEKRLTTDKDMPPEDSTEYEMFRVKNPDALNAVRDWLDTELKNLKAN